jgi:amino acid adenylation domain-containing protein
MMTQVEQEPVQDMSSGPIRARFWKFLQVAPVPARAAHHAVVTVHCDGPLDTDALGRALEKVTTWYPALTGRMVIPDAALGDGKHAIAVRQVAAADESAASAALQAHATTPLDLEAGPLLNVLLVTRAGHSTMGLVTHRLVCDPASLMTVVDRLAEQYATEVGTAGPNPGSDAPIPWTEDAVAPAADVLVAELHEQIRNLPLEVTLPGMRPRKASPDFGYADHEVNLGAEATAAVRATAAQLGVSTTTVFLSCFRALLHRLAGQDAVLVMAELDRRPVDHRPGCWTDLVPLALSGAHDLSFADLVTTTDRQLDAAHRRPAVSIPELANRSQTDPTAAATLGRVVFATRPADRVMAVAGTTWTSRVVEPPVSEFDLGLIVREAAAGTSGQSLLFVYEPGMLPQWAVEVIGRSFARLLHCVTATPEHAVDDLDVIDEHDRRMLLERWNGPADLVPVDLPVPKVFEALALAHPDTPAVHDKGTTYTYAQVNTWANRLAHALRAGGVTKADVVGLYIPRSVEWVIGYLAVYKLGAVTLALDPRAPLSRLEAAIAASPPVAVIAPSSKADATAIGGIDVVRIDLDSEAVRHAATENPDVPLDLDDLAYIVQTSGSTGRPRAVFGVHRAHAHLSLEVAAVMGIGPGARTSWLVDAAAGISISLVWRALCAGATLYIVGDDELVSPVELQKWHLEHGLTHTFVTTQMAEPLTALPWPADCSLRVMEIGGEKVRKWPSADLPFDAIVAYGSNEAFLVTSMLFPWAHRLTARTATADDRRMPPPVGRPLPGVNVYVVDADLRLLPPGVVGEVWVATPELMLGYLGEPAESARRIRPNPFGPAGSRLFRTGDMGAVRPDGMLELTGRSDDMIKIRGFRVEPAAVEAILTDHPAVRAAAVVGVADGAGNNQLVACVVPQLPVSPEELRTYMLRHAPGYMVPVAYVPMERLPMGVLNKIVRKQLPPDNWSDYRPRAAYRAPTNADEATLTRIWADVLEDDRIGVDDSLIDMGGSSLDVGRAQVRIAEQMAVDVSIRQIFETPTPAGIAAVIQRTNPARRKVLPPVMSRSARRSGT